MITVMSKVMTITIVTVRLQMGPHLEAKVKFEMMMMIQRVDSLLGPSGQLLLRRE